MSLPPPDLRAVLGAELVDRFLEAAAAAGDAFLPGDEDLAFGFVQRVLVRLKQSGHNHGLLYPKFDAEYNRLFDFMDGDGGVWVLRPFPVDPAWFVPHDTGAPDQAYYGLAPGAAVAIVRGFLAAWAGLRLRAGGGSSDGQVRD